MVDEALSAVPVLVPPLDKLPLVDPVALVDPSEVPAVLLESEEEVVLPLVPEAALAAESGMQSTCTGLLDRSFAMPVSLSASLPALGCPSSLHSGLPAAVVPRLEAVEPLVPVVVLALAEPLVPVVVLPLAEPFAAALPVVELPLVVSSVDELELPGIAAPDEVPLLAVVDELLLGELLAAGELVEPGNGVAVELFSWFWLAVLRESALLLACANAAGAAARSAAAARALMCWDRIIRFSW